MSLRPGTNLQALAGDKPPSLDVSPRTSLMSPVVP